MGRRVDRRRRRPAGAVPRYALGDRLLREFVEQIETLRAELVNKREQLEIIKEQRKAAERQINEARKRYRQGELEFQDFLDHWERYRSVRLDRWSIQGELWRARADLIAVAPELPEVCR